VKFSQNAGELSSRDLLRSLSNTQGDTECCGSHMPTALAKKFLDETNVALKACSMSFRIRHCVECPKCCTRYLIGFSPYRNGSFLVSFVAGSLEEYTLFCSCGRPAIHSRWRWSELKTYAVSNRAYDRGYGPPEEIVPVNNERRSPS